MAYTYNDFLKAASGSNMMNRFDDNDLKITKTNPEYGLSLLRLMKDQDGAVSPEARLLANEAISQLKTNYSAPGFLVDVSDGHGGADDLPDELPSVEPTPEKEPTSTGFQYDKEDEYQKLLKNITSSSKFRYDFENDPVWSAYRKNYLREGERATQDALTRAAAATGGVPSTYALMAAQQAGANYADQLSSIIPALEQNAYDRYLNERNQKLTALNALEADRTDAYGKYLDAYQMLQEQISPTQTETSLTDGGAQLAEGDLAYLKEKYPSGQITSESVWNAMLSRYTEATLNAAGYYYSDGSDNPLKALLERIGGKLADSPIGSIYDKIAGNG